MADCCTPIGSFGKRTHFTEVPADGAPGLSGAQDSGKNLPEWANFFPFLSDESSSEDQGEELDSPSGKSVFGGAVSSGGSTRSSEEEEGDNDDKEVDAILSHEPVSEESDDSVCSLFVSPVCLIGNLPQFLRRKKEVDDYDDEEVKEFLSQFRVVERLPNNVTFLWDVDVLLGSLDRAGDHRAGRTS